MSYFDPDIYNADNLKDEDKKRVDEIEDLKERILSEDVIEEFLSKNSICGETTNAILKEMLEPFVEYLREQTEYYICDVIIGAIEDYTDEELKCLIERNKNKKGICSNEDKMD